jgi:hypothetical protein
MIKKKKEGQIWISAVLFISLGVVVISLLLAATIPMVNRITDKNTMIRSKEILLKIDDTIKTVANEGPGSQRQLDPLVIEKGALYFENGTYFVMWVMETESELMEKDIEIIEGNIHQRLNSTFVEEVNQMQLWVTSDKFNTSLNSKFTSPYKGQFLITVKHTGKFINDNPIVEIKLT